jgi:hypothetical protein
MSCAPARGTEVATSPAKVKRQKSLQDVVAAVRNREKTIRAIHEQTPSMNKYDTAQSGPKKSHFPYDDLVAIHSLNQRLVYQKSNSKTDLHSNHPKDN